jgi:hypothetical protein
MSKTTIPETVEVLTDPLIETIAFLEHVADVIDTLNGRQSTPLGDCFNKAAERLSDAAFPPALLSGAELWECVAMVRQAFTEKWAGDISKDVSRRLQPA